MKLKKFSSVSEIINSKKSIMVSDSHSYKFIVLFLPENCSSMHKLFNHRQIKTFFKEVSLHTVVARLSVPGNTSMSQNITTATLIYPRHELYSCFVVLHVVYLKKFESGSKPNRKGHKTERIIPFAS